MDWPPSSGLAPMAAVHTSDGLESDFSETRASLPGHDFVGTRTNRIQPGRSGIQGQADGIEDGGFPRSSGPCDGEDAISRIITLGEIDSPFAIE